nr:helix-turn-helix transcriptional regulator [Nocardioides soli]
MGQNLRAERHAAGLTQERLALDAGLDRSFYVDVENGHHSLAVDRLFAIAEALGISADRLLAGID